MLSVSDRFWLMNSPYGCEMTGSRILLALVRCLDHWLGCLGATGSVALGCLLVLAKVFSLWV